MTTNATTTTNNYEHLTPALTELFVALWQTSKSLRLDWIRSIRAKLALNAKKYPVELCKGQAGKYTEYSHVTGITTTNQSTRDFHQTDDGDNTSNNNHNDPLGLSIVGFAEDHLESLADEINDFSEARLWTKYHKPRNLILALLGEAGELAEILQYEGDDWDDNNEDENDNQSEPPRPHLIDRLHATDKQKTLDNLSQELADVSIYAMRLATVCGVVGALRDSLVSSGEDDFPDPLGMVE